jgi:Fe-S-cluster containining protein
MKQQQIQRRPLFEKLSQLYSQMEEAYNHTAAKIGLSCSRCPDNCCTSYFHHHTYIEWAYVWEGMRSRSEENQREFINRAESYVRQSQVLTAQGLKPNIMCPLNDQGLCQLYEYRLMICRLHGVPNRFVRPDGKEMNFPGCFRCQELCSHLEKVPVVDRTNLYRELACLEMAFLGQRVKTLARVNLTLADMLVEGPPDI